MESSNLKLQPECHSNEIYLLSRTYHLAAQEEIDTHELPSIHHEGELEVVDYQPLIFSSQQTNSEQKGAPCWAKMRTPGGGKDA